MLSKISFSKGIRKGRPGYRKIVEGLEVGPTFASCGNSGLPGSGPCSSDITKVTPMFADPVSSDPTRSNCVDPASSGPGVPYNFLLLLSSCSHEGAFDSEYVIVEPPLLNVFSEKTNSNGFDTRATGGS